MTSSRKSRSCSPRLGSPSILIPAQLSTRNGSACACPAQYAWSTGREAPVDVMRDVLRQAISAARTA